MKGEIAIMEQVSKQSAFLRTPGGRTFLIIWAGQVISLIGSQLTGFGLGVWVYEQNSSATEFALNLVAFIMPSIIFAPIAGMIVDRYDRRLVLMGSDLLAGVSTISVLALYATGY